MLLISTACFKRIVDGTQPADSTALSHLHGCLGLPIAAVTAGRRYLVGLRRSEGLEQGGDALHGGLLPCSLAQRCRALGHRLLAGLADVGRVASRQKRLLQRLLHPRVKLHCCSSKGT